MPPLTIGCVFFCLGIVFEMNNQIPAFWIIFIMSLSLGLLVIFFKHQWIPEVLLMIFVFLLGAQTLANKFLISSDSVLHLINNGKQNVQLKGIVTCDVESSKRNTSFILQVTSIKKGGDDFRSSGEVFVRSYYLGYFSYGEELILEGSLYKYQGRLMLSVKNKPGAIVKTGIKKGFWIKQIAIFLKHRMHQTVFATLSPFYASILSAMVLGEGRNLPLFIKEMMVKIGTWHVVVVSGSHTVFVAFIILVFLKLLRISRRMRIFLTMGLLWIYCLVTGACAPVVRATVMTEAFLLSYLLERNPLFLNSLSLAALVILIFDPLQLFNIGFQLSFLSVFFIVVLSPPMIQLVMRKLPEEPWIIFIVSCFFVSFAAWLGTSPVIAYTFGNFSLIAVLANMVVVPLATVVISAGFALVIFGSFSHFLTYPIGCATEFLIFVFLKTNQIFSACPYASFAFPRMPLVLLIFCYCLLLLFTYFLIYFKENKPH